MILLSTPNTSDWIMSILPFQNNELVGIFKEDEVDRGIGRAGYGTPPFIHSDIKIPSRDSTIKIINRLPAVRPILD